MASPATLQIIRREHALLSAVLRSMTMLVRDARRADRTPEFRVLRAMLFYVDEFPERLHHVKETAMLFPRLRERTHEADAVLARLDRDHHDGAPRIRDLEHRLTAWEMLGEPRRKAFESALEDYEAFYLEHMRVEEEQVLPLAERTFDAADWSILDRAFGAHRDPLAMAEADPHAPYVDLFRRIVQITPAPYGLGDAVKT